MTAMVRNINLLGTLLSPTKEYRYIPPTSCGDREERKAAGEATAEVTGTRRSCALQARHRADRKRDQAPRDRAHVGQNRGGAGRDRRCGPDGD